MYLFEPKWKTLIATTVDPLFTPSECQDIIKLGQKQKPGDGPVGKKDGPGSKLDSKIRNSKISWIPFHTLPDMYNRIEQAMHKINCNHFGYEGMKITEPAQYTEYYKGGFYNWHMDTAMNCQSEPPIRKISMTILLSPPSDFKGGLLEFIDEGNYPKDLFQGQAIFFCSLLRHRVNKITKGIRKSLVMWFGGPSFK